VKEARWAVRKTTVLPPARLLKSSRMFDDFELIDVFGAVVLLLLLASVAVVVFATPEVSQRPEPPEADWSIEKVNDSHIQIRHEGGEPVDPENLTIIVKEYPRPTEWSMNGSDGLVREGDYTYIQISDDQDIALYWSASEDTIKREPLARGQT